MPNNDVGIFASQISGHLFTPVGSYDALATVTVPSGGVSTISFVGIPAGYRHLQIRAINKSTTNGDYDWSIQFNGDTGANYTKHQIFADGSSTYATGTASTNQAPCGFNYYTAWNATIVDILDYASTSKNKTVKTLGGADNNGSGIIGMRSGVWMNTSAVSSILLIQTAGGSGFAQYSQFALYGIK